MPKVLRNQRGAALLLTSIFMMMSLSMFSMLNRRLLMLMNVVQFETYLDEPPSHVLETGLARALSLMQTGPLPAAYNCSLVILETAGSPTVNLSWTPQGAKWQVTVVASPSVPFPSCPPDFSDLTGAS